MNQISRSLLGEFLGTAALTCVVVGSGIMGAQLSDDDGVALIINALSTILALGILIYLFMPLSGAQLNPVVTMIVALRKEMSPALAVGHIAAQLVGGILGVLVANTMFGLSTVQISTTAREPVGLLLGEVIATAGLVVVIFVSIARSNTALLPILVPAWIGSAYFFTSSTSFANPAVTIGRMFTDTFAGISPSSVLPFIGAQILGALIGWSLTALFRVPLNNDHEA